jgi:hypothetical protein
MEKHDNQFRDSTHLWRHNFLMRPLNRSINRALASSPPGALPLIQIGGVIPFCTISRTASAITQFNK